MGTFRSIMDIVLIFLEYVRVEGAKDQLVIGDKMARITDSISPDNPSIRAEEKSGLDRTTVPSRL